MVTVPLCSPYDGKALRLLSGVLFDVKRTVEGCAISPLSEVETVQVTRAVADRLMRTFDSGERDFKTLKRAAMTALNTPLAQSC